MSDVQPMDPLDMVELAACAVGKIDAKHRPYGGATWVTEAEIEAMAALLFLVGVPALSPGAVLPSVDAVTGGFCGPAISKLDRAAFFAPVLDKLGLHSDRRAA